MQGAREPHGKRSAHAAANNEAQSVDCASQAVRELRRSQSGRLERDLPFSWQRCLVSIVSYGLLLTDVLRTGLGVESLHVYVPVEPDSVLYFGPYAYPVVHIARHENDTTTLPYWAYKYDTTSTSVRATVQQLRVSTWPPCVTYQGPECAETDGLTRTTVFDMIDGLVERVSKHRSGGSRAGHVVLRDEHLWVDRLNHLVLPWLFRRVIRRTSQAIFFSTARLKDEHRPICGHERPRPFACDEVWINFAHHCRASNPLCSEVTDVWHHLTQRLRRLQQQYPNASLDAVVVEGMDDFSRGGLMFHGRKLYDIVVLTRIRSCSEGGCETLAVDDYRYEGALLTTSATDWYSIIAWIRATGQGYTWARVVSLIAGIFYARSSESELERSALSDRIFFTIRTFFLIPSQVIIYGSLFPIWCYVIAHTMDASIVYELVAHHFNSPLGVYRFDLATFVRISAVSMRSVWVVASVCHSLLSLHCRRSWSPNLGIPGIPEFFISILASITVFAQVRALSWRSTEVLQVHDVAAASLRLQRVRGQQYDSCRGLINQIVLGTTIDTQFLMCSMWFVSTIATFLWALHRVSPRCMPYTLRMVSRTYVSYSASNLWPVNALVVSWSGSVVTDERKRSRRPRRQASEASATSLRPLFMESDSPRRRRSGSRLLSRLHVLAHSALSSIRSGSTDFRRELSLVHKRGASADSSIYLVNLATMTDPIMLLLLRTHSGRLIGLFKSRRTNQLLLLPHSMFVSDSDLPLDWTELELVMWLSTARLYWCDLLHAG
ncbi:hypothetical protein P43SY_009686 [Pythium insidiosum]|uniref:Transmembrane protein n=1 Tax=Pythium insidiosum TaxID=114742 RepID=A0AAD5Q9X5_PYTIN|nr:hypothetical protein P43SY_009686 [Pythium insidiosum]